MLDLVISLGCYDRRVTSYISTSILMSVRSQLLDTEAMCHDWQALQFFSKLNKGEIKLNATKVGSGSVLLHNRMHLVV